MSKEVVNNSNWSTSDELKFLDGLGNYKPSPKEKPLERKARLLSRYIATAKRRQDWGTLDRWKVVHHAEEVLKVIKGKSA